MSWRGSKIPALFSGLGPFKVLCYKSGVLFRFVKSCRIIAATFLFVVPLKKYEKYIEKLMFKCEIIICLNVVLCLDKLLFPKHSFQNYRTSY